MQTRVLVMQSRVSIMQTCVLVIVFQLCKHVFHYADTCFIVVQTRVFINPSHLFGDGGRVLLPEPSVLG